VNTTARYRNQNNALNGTAAENAFIRELERYGGVVWSPGAENSARYKKDVLGFDILCLTPGDVLLCQIKATAREPWPPAPIWRARFLALPHPPGVRYMLCWLTPDSPATWRTWRLLSDGTRLEVAWPPVGVTA
jgi:hypothetical protein